METILTPHYTHEAFSAAYYGERGNNGFGPEIHWDNPAQQEQLGYKWAYLENYSFSNILFIGCARGAELRYFKAKRKAAFGVEVSKWAVENAYTDVKDYIQLYDGIHIPHPSQTFDVVACFDVLTLVPRDVLDALGKEMQRVAKNLILFRATFKTFQNVDDPVDGQDGVVFKAPELYDYDRAMTGEFAMDSVTIDRRYIGVFRYTRNKAS